MSNPAETYESYMGPALFSPWAKELLKRANLQRGERVLDVATGTGIVARHAAKQVGSDGEVAGLDLNPNMLAVARTRAAREGVSVEWHEGRAEALPFEEGRFDLVTCQFAMMFFTDQTKALTEMRRVLKRGGRVAIEVFQSIEQHPFYTVLDKVIQKRLGMSGVKDIFVLGNANELRTLATEAGFQNVTIDSLVKTARFPDPEGFLAGEIAVDTAAIPSMQHVTDAERQVIVQDIREEMELPLRAVTEGNEVVLPFHVFLVRAERN